METKSGQPLSPCVEINGHMLADVSGEEVETVLDRQQDRAGERRSDGRSDQCAVPDRAARGRGEAQFLIVKSVTTLKRLNR